MVILYEDETVIMCGPGPLVEKVRKPDGETRWCFQCRARVSFDYVYRDTPEPTYWGGVPSIECRERGHHNGDLFPGRYREWEG